MAKTGRAINESNRSLSRYLEEIGKYEPLKPEEEIVCAQLIKKGNYPALKKINRSRSKVCCVSSKRLSRARASSNRPD